MDELVYVVLYDIGSVVRGHVWPEEEEAELRTLYEQHKDDKSEYYSHCH